MKKKVRDLSGASPNLKKALQNRAAKDGVGTGFGNSELYEPVPKYIQASSEVIYKNNNNAWIVLGRDRPSDRFSGFGGRGDTQAASIDLVAGRMSYAVREIDDFGGAVHVDNNYRYDAARMVISQKTNIDENFGIVEGKVGSPSPRSGIGIKADSVRIIGREGIKLVTKIDSENSQGGDIVSVAGIDLIAGNDDRDLQPIPKGENLKAAIGNLYDTIKDLTGLLETFITSQMKLNQSIMSHTHIAPPSGGPVTPSPQLIVAGIATSVDQSIKNIAQLPQHRAKMEINKVKYLEPFGDSYINSRHNNTN